MTIRLENQLNPYEHRLYGVCIPVSYVYEDSHNGVQAVIESGLFLPARATPLNR